MTEELETVWHGAWWRTIPPPPAAPRVLPLAAVPELRPPERPTRDQQRDAVYAAVGRDWQTTRAIALTAGLTSDTATRYLARLHAQGAIERRRPRHVRRGLLYRRCP